MKQMSQGVKAGVVGGVGRLEANLAALLGLLDFSTLMGRSEDFERGLEALLYSLMGEFAARSGVVLLTARPGTLSVAVAKGQGAAGHLGRALEVDEARVAADGVVSDAAVRSGAGALVELSRALSLDLLVPLVHDGRLVGLIGLGQSARQGYGPGERALAERIGEIAATVVANRQLVGEMERLNRKLSIKVHQLHTVFDVSRELNRSLEEESIHHVLVTTVMGQVLVRQVLVLCEAPVGRVEAVIARGLELSEAERAELAAESFAALVAGVGQGLHHGAVGAIMARTGLVQLVPVNVGEEVRAFIGVGPRLDHRPIEAEEREFIQTLGAQAVVACDNLRLHREMAVKERLEREMAIARDIQARLLPGATPILDGFEIAAVSRPCYEVGGDTYDFLELGGELGLAIGDVVGKSIPAALTMASVHASLRAHVSHPGSSPAGLMTALNGFLVRSLQSGRFVTFFLALLDRENGRLRYVNAGHNPPLLFSADGRVEALSEGGLVLGIFEEAGYAEGTARLLPGDTLVLYTDGVTEFMDAAEEEFGMERLEAAVRSRHGWSASDVVAGVLADLAAFAGGVPARDDVTLVVVRRLA